MMKKGTRNIAIAVGVFVVIIGVGLAYESATGLHMLTGEKKTSGVGSDKWKQQEETKQELPGMPVPTQPNCDRAYPTECIPMYPPDLDCEDIPSRNFEVLQPDPHGFDADKDGIGCEG
jgi:hypothetical protein